MPRTCYVRLSILALCFALFDPSASAAPSAGAPGRMVDVGGRRLHLVCVGTGSPTVVFESGLGEGWYSWALVQPKVGEHFRACSYDRSGIGFSDPDPAARTVARLVDDLHELLLRSGEPGPYLLVGHSLGGLSVRRYAKRYPAGVAALVLVDSVHEDGRRDTPPEVEAARKKALAARAGQLAQWHASGHFEEMDFHDKLPKNLATLLTPRSATAAWWDARFAENTLPDASDSLTAAERHLDVPIVVITATEWPTPVGYPAAPWKQQLATRLRLQDELATRSDHSKHLFAKTEHSVQLADPALVVNAIAEAVREWRASTDTGRP